MTQEHDDGTHRPPGEGRVEDHSFDELARGLAEGTISRGRVLRWVGAAALAAAVPPLFPTQAFALTPKQRRRCRSRGGTVCGRFQRSQVCCPAGRPCCGTARGGICCPSGGRCVGDRCLCPTGETECSGACVDLNTDESNCGACGNTCPEGASCVDGSCGCPPGETECDGRCVDLNTDENNCRTCGNACPEGAGCVEGTCVCPPGTFLCDEDPDLGASCVECGCGVGCTDDRACCGGTCCPSGQVCCNHLEGTCALPGEFCGA